MQASAYFSVVEDSLANDLVSEADPCPDTTVPLELSLSACTEVCLRARTVVCLRHGIEISLMIF